MTRGQGPLNTLLPQPGQSGSYHPSYHPLPGQWAQDQMQKPAKYKDTSARSTGSKQTEIQRAIASERAQHEYWEEWQGVTPGKAEYEDPRAWQNTLLPTAKYGTEGRGYG